jgi:UDP-3-O-[3-hydroxymyristoyl] glucosamine N-acyltransferase
MIAGGSGVTGPVAAGAKVAGYPHMEASRWRRMVAAVRALPELLRRVRRLEAALADSRKEDE